MRPQSLLQNNSGVRLARLAFQSTGFALALWALALCALPLATLAAEPPKTGDKAPEFTLQSLDGQMVKLSELTPKANVVLVVLRGWPGYQCPICDRQVNDFVRSLAGFTNANARVVFVYPGPADGLKAHAEEFKKWRGREWPREFDYLLDPDYAMVNAYGLRWDAPKETAYPSTFVVDTKGMVQFAKISKTHGGRSSAEEVIKALDEVK